MNSRLFGSASRTALVAAGLCTALAAFAQQNTKPPKVQLWLDVSTGGMAGFPEVEMPAGMSPLGGAHSGYGMARGMNVSPPRVLDIALYNSLRPGVEAAQAVPSGMRMGDRLPLLPPQVQPPERDLGEVPEELRRDTPKGRLLIYWGCGEAVRSGQPRVIDLARANPAEMGAALAGRHAPDRGARVSPQYALFPNEKQRQALPAGSSLVGEHRIEGAGVPASMKFTLGAVQDLMPRIELSSRGSLKESVALSWAAVPHARAYYLHAMGQIGSDLVLWSSSDAGDSGMGLFDYLPNATIDRWQREKVLLKPDTTSCAVPKGIFAAPPGAGGDDSASAMLRMIAYGSESNIVHPPRPADPRAAWEPEWAVRVRVKSGTMALLGQEQGGRNPGAAASTGTSVPATVQAAPAAPANPFQNALESVLPIPNPAGALRGLFGR